MLQTSQKVVADQLKEERNSPKLPRFSMMWQMADPIARALIAMMLGCDACPGGLPKIGPQKALEIFEKFKGKSGKQLHEELATAMSNVPNAPIKDPQAILCLCHSMIYEKIGQGDCDYVHGEAPKRLHKFNSDFKSGVVQTAIIPK